MQCYSKSELNRRMMLCTYNYKVNKFTCKLLSRDFFMVKKLNSEA